ncbi:late cornified envelope protein 1F-like [Monodelphis domestica]|nr:late cornified envelope protein 1F-like [Monodelphis domestica]
MSCQQSQQQCQAPPKCQNPKCPPQVSAPTLAPCPPPESSCCEPSSGCCCVTGSGACCASTSGGCCNSGAGTGGGFSLFPHRPWRSYRFWNLRSSSDCCGSGGNQPGSGGCC